jgi:hypothetical protein
VEDEIPEVGAVVGDLVNDRLLEAVFISSVHSRPSTFGGAYCTKTDIMCLPGGAMVGSVSEGIIMSR